MDKMDGNSKINYKKKWYLEHREEILLKRKQYYQEHKKECKERSKQHYLDNRDEYLKRDKTRRLNKKEEIAAYRKEYRAEHKEIIAKQYREWKQNNRAKVNADNAVYRSKNKEKIRAHKLEYNNLKEGKATNYAWRYRYKDKEKGFDISSNVSKEWILENIFTSKCIYCGEDKWERLGCDRIDNTKPHTPDNCVPCCFICNVDRGDRYSVEEFKVYRSLHPRACDLQKAPKIVLSGSGALKKRELKLN